MANISQGVNGAFLYEVSGRGPPLISFPSCVILPIFANVTELIRTF